MDRHATIVAAIDAFCKEHGLTRSAVLVRGALALIGIPLKAAEEMQQLRHATREYDRHINKRLRLNAAALARDIAKLRAKRANY